MIKCVVKGTKFETDEIYVTRTLILIIFNLYFHEMYLLKLEIQQIQNRL